MTNNILSYVPRAVASAALPDQRTRFGTSRTLVQTWTRIHDAMLAAAAPAPQRPTNDAVEVVGRVRQPFRGDRCTVMSFAFAFACRHCADEVDVGTRPRIKRVKLCDATSETNYAS